VSKVRELQGDVEAARVRRRLRATRGAILCPYKPCQVITQPVYVGLLAQLSAVAGERQHREIVHGMSYSDLPGSWCSEAR